MAFREPADPLFGILSGHDGGNVAGECAQPRAWVLRPKCASTHRAPHSALRAAARATGTPYRS